LAAVKDIVIIDASLLLAADAGEVVTTQLHPARTLKVVVERTVVSLHTDILLAPWI